MDNNSNGRYSIINYNQSELLFNKGLVGGRVISLEIKFSVLI